MNTKILAMCIVGLMAVGGIGMLAAKPLSGVTGTQVLARGDVGVETIGVDNVGYQIWTGTGWGAAVVGVKLSFTADIAAGTYIGISVRDASNIELGYDAGVTAAAISAGVTTTFYLWNMADEEWQGSAPPSYPNGYDPEYPFPQIPLVDHLIVTVAGNSEYVTSPVP